MNRRKFAKLAGSAALITPGVAVGFSPAPTVETQTQQQQPSATPPAEAKPKYGMTKEQEEQVKQSIARRERQNAALRARTIPYATEAAFVFRVKEKEVRKSRGEEVKAK